MASMASSKKKTQARIESIVNKSVLKQINIMDIERIYKVVEDGVTLGLDDAILMQTTKAFVDTISVKA